jgi:hypothetical protein
MRKRTLIVAGLLALILVLVAGALAAQPGLSRAEPLPQRPAATYCSDSFCLDWQVLAGSLGEMESASYRLRGTLGQTMAGLFSSTSYELHAGYWAGVQSGDRVFLPALMRE